jgi:hypothetical protein
MSILSVKMPTMPLEYQKAFEKLRKLNIPAYETYPFKKSYFNPLGFGGLYQKTPKINPEYDEARNRIFAEIPSEVKAKYHKELLRWMTLM